MYILNRDGFKFKIATTIDGKSWTATVYKNDLNLGEIAADNPEDLVEELNSYIDQGVIV